MKSNVVKIGVLLMVFSLLTPTSFCDQGTILGGSKAIGVVLTDGRVSVNGNRVERGTTVFNGNEIQTSDASVFVNLTSGGGVISIAPGTRVKISREQDKIVAEVFKGSVTIRSSLASTVISPNRVVNSEPNNLYAVSVVESGTNVESFQKSLTARSSDGAVETIAAKAVDSQVSASALRQVQPGPIDQEPATPVDRSFITANCVYSDNSLDVYGVVVCNSVGVDGATVTLTLFSSNGRPIVINQTTTTDEAGRYRFTVADNSLGPGGTARVMARTPIRNCRLASNTCEY